MTKEDILDLFRQRAAMLGEVKDSQHDIIMDLAQLLAESRGKLSKENFEMLVHIGAVMYQEGLRDYRARVEVANTMEASHAARNAKT